MVSTHFLGEDPHAWNPRSFMAGAEDGGAFPPGVLLEERIPSEEDVANAAPFGIEMFGHVWTQKSGDLHRIFFWVLVLETGDWAPNIWPF